jgi:hypothetical protein
MYNHNGPNIIIIDEAQLTYWDIEFWINFLKPIAPSSSDRIILFASYGSPTGYVTEEGALAYIPDHRRVSLWPVDHKDGITPAGLFLTAEEFTDVVVKAYPTGPFEEDFLDYVLLFTAGHVGAVTDLLAAVRAHSVRLHIKQQHSLIMVSSHAVNSSMTTGNTRWKSFRPNFLSRTCGCVSRRAAYSDVGSPCLWISRSRTSLECSVQCLATIM